MGLKRGSAIEIGFVTFLVTIWTIIYLKLFAVSNI